MERQKVNLYAPMAHTQPGPPPLAVKVLTMPNTIEVYGGPLATAYKEETYVLLSVLPEELRRRVVLAIEALASAV